MGDAPVTCRHCGHDVGVHGDRAVIGCGTAVRAALSPFRVVQCPCPGFAEGVPVAMPLPPLRPPDPPPVVTDPVAITWQQYLRDVVLRGRLGR